MFCCCSLAAFARNNTNLDELSIVRRSKHEYTASSDFDLWSGYRNMFVPMNTSTLHWSAVANQCVVLTESTACFEVCWSGDFLMRGEFYEVLRRKYIELTSKYFTSY